MVFLIGCIAGICASLGFGGGTVLILFLTLFFLSNLADGANLLIFALFASGNSRFGGVLWSLFSEAAFE